MNNKAALYDTYAKASKRRLELSKYLLSSTYENENSSINNIIRKVLLERIQEKESRFSDEIAGSELDVGVFDISELESGISLFLEDIVLNGKDQFGFYSKLKRIFSDIGFQLVFYPSVYLESPPLSINQNLFFIGIPREILTEKEYTPLVFHEIGHCIVDASKFESLNEILEDEIDRLEKRAFYGSNLNRVNLRYLSKARFYKRATKEWLREIVSDIFGAYMLGLPYLSAFLLYQLNKHYLSNIEDHPPNKLRFLYVVNYLGRIGEIKANTWVTNFFEVVRSDPILDAKVGMLKDVTIQEQLFEGFELQVMNNRKLDENRKRLRKIFR